MTGWSGGMGGSFFFGSGFGCSGSLFATSSVCSTTFSMAGSLFGPSWIGSTVLFVVSCFASSLISTIVIFFLLDKYTLNEHLENIG